MSSYFEGDDKYPPQLSYASQPRYSDRNGRMYDDRRSHSPPPRPDSPTGDRRYDTPGGTHSPPHDVSRTPPRGPAADRRYTNDDGDYPGSRTFRHDPRGVDRSEPRRASRSPRQRRGRSGGYRDRDRDHESYRSPRYGSRSRSRSRSHSRTRSPRRRRPPHYGTESREVMMEGLPMDMNEDDISNELTQYYHVEGIQEVRVIRDRQTNMSRQLGFLRFHNLDYSRDFLERNFPTIYLYGNDPSNADAGGLKVRIAYSREREDRNRVRAEGEWTCPNCSIVNYPGRQKCFRCQIPRSESVQASPPSTGPPPRAVNNGDNDVSTDGTPSQFLLFRGLEPSVTEEVLSKGVSKLYRPSSGSQGQGGSSNAKKGAKVASTTGDTNLGARDGSIRRVLLVRNRRSNESWRFGFAEFATVGDAQAAVTRYNSFETFTISSKPVLTSYIHAGVFVPVLNPTPSTERFTFSPLGNPAMKLAYWDEEAYVTELKVSTGELDLPKSRAEDASADKAAKAGKEGDKSKKRKPNATGNSGTKKLAMSSHLQFWSDRHAELHGIRKKAEDGNGTESKSEDVDRGAPSKGGGAIASPSPVPTQSYGDQDRKCCYLCMRQFKTATEVNKHERLSQLHRDNLQNEELKAKAQAKLAKKANGQQESSSATEYRDRAKERRRTFGSSKNKSKDKGKSAPEEEEETQSAQPAMTKGASLLGKMGWSEGSGLGAQGTGMTAPVATELYVQGVGLGAQGGKVGDAVEEAGRNTRGRYDEFLEKTKDNARERYERLSKEGR